MLYLYHIVITSCNHTFHRVFYCKEW